MSRTVSINKDYELSVLLIVSVPLANWILVVEILKKLKVESLNEGDY